MLGTIMEDKFGKKIASLLDEAPLSKNIEDRLAKAREIALSRARSENFIEVEKTTKGAIQLKSKFAEFHDGFKWLMWLSIGLMFIVLQQGYMDNQESETVQYLSSDYVQYKEKLTLDQEKFTNWKHELNSLIDDEIGRAHV